MQKENRLLKLCLSFGCLIPQLSFAVELGISPSGYTGALSTPVAESLKTGDAVLAYSNGLDAIGKNFDPVGHNYVVGIGLLPNVELFGRLATEKINANCYEGCGVRDLSASVKWTLPELNWLFAIPDSPWIPQVAIGATDIGGAVQVQYFRSLYGALSWDNTWLSTNIGYAKALSSTRIGPQVNGLFGSVVVQPVDWLQTIAEYDGNHPQIGLRLMTPDSTLPLDFRLSTDVRYTWRDQNKAKSDKVFWGLSLQRALSLVGEKNPPIINRQSSPDTRVATTDLVVTPSQPQIISAPVSASLLSEQKQYAEVLASQLKKSGFQDISIGTSRDGLVVSVENQAYQWNELDALGAVLGVFYRVLPTDKLYAVTVILKKEGLPVLRVSSDNQCLQAWADDHSHCQQPVLRDIRSLASAGSVSRIAEENATDWLVQSFQPTRWHPRVEFSPVLNYALGTEYGAFDYSAGLATTLELPMAWSGLLGEIRHVSVLDNSRNYQDKGIFESQGLESGIDRAMLHQYISAPLGITSHIALGRMNHDLDGGFVENQLYSNKGDHQFTLTAGYFKVNQSGAKDNHKPLIVGYRYQVPQYDIQLGVKAGEFLDGDRGYKVESRFFYGDTAISVFYQSTKHDIEDKARSFAGLAISLPLTPRYVKPLAYGQIRGNKEYNQSVSTEVDNYTNLVLDSQQRGRLSDVPYSIDTRLYNRDRLSKSYLDQHHERIQTVFQNVISD